ncbi:hypothetical protein K2173_004165 [Erythroxylum novogranatense]|uniref:Uncharacterized protein n=1 Tax=Erythroxylum novogranatense TaxID=1862640 RepID=A0AAV8SYT3_9ROSI|nr:hypothetical protein K2173_004165 [Erythroxylum novogranatense]
MSTDLHVVKDLPAIRLSPIKIEAVASCSVDDDVCRTPTSEVHMIPVVVSCPPAPRKPRRRSVKRKLSEVEFFEIVNREEVESFFRSSFEVISKRRFVNINTLNIRIKNRTES